MIRFSQQHGQKSGGLNMFFSHPSDIFHQECLKRVLLREERVNTSYDFFVRLRPEPERIGAGSFEVAETMKGSRSRPEIGKRD